LRPCATTNPQDEAAHMGFAISITAPGGAPLRALWDRFAPFEDTPSMAALSYPPHVTLAVYDTIEEDRLRDALHRVFAKEPPMSLRFTRLSRFETPGLVFFAAPERCEPLWRAHAAVHAVIDPSSCDPHYRPGNWVPHCTLATRVTAANAAQAKALADGPI